MSDNDWDADVDDADDVDQPPEDDCLPCPECGAVIYDDSVQCPRCGTYLPADNYGNETGWWYWLCRLAIILLLILFLGPALLMLALLLRSPAAG